MVHHALGPEHDGPPDARTLGERLRAPGTELRYQHFDLAADPWETHGELRPAAGCDPALLDDLRAWQEAVKDPLQRLLPPPRG